MDSSSDMDIIPTGFEDQSTPIYPQARLDSPQLADDFDPDQFMMDTEPDTSNLEVQDEPLLTTENDTQPSYLTDTLLDQPNLQTNIFYPSTIGSSRARPETPIRSSFFNPAPATFDYPIAPPISFTGHQLQSPTPSRYLVVKTEPNEDDYMSSSPPRSQSPIPYDSSDRNTPFASQAASSMIPLDHLSSPSTDLQELSIQQGALTMDCDDDDLMEIDLNMVPDFVKHRWEEHRQFVGSENTDRVKREPTDDGAVQPPRTSGRPISIPSEPLSSTDAAALQRQMIENAKNMKPRKKAPRKAFEKEAFTSNREREEYWAQGLYPDDPEHVDAAMRDIEDHSWMDRDEPDDDEYGELVERIHALKTKANSAKISPLEKTQLIKLSRKKAGEDRLRAAAQDNSFEDNPQEELFVQETRKQVADRHRRECPRSNDSPTPEGDEQSQPFARQSTTDEDEDAALGRMLESAINGQDIEGVPEQIDPTAKPRKKRKSSGPRAKTAREVRDRERAKELEKINKKSTRQTLSNPRGKKATKGKPKPKGRKGAKGVKKSKRGKATRNKDTSDDTSDDDFEPQETFAKGRVGNVEDDVGQMLLNDLMDNDAIAHRSHPVFDVGPEPEFTGKNKHTLLQQLFENIPDGSDKKAARSDRQKLLRASKSFGYAKVKAKDGKWQVKGMQSSLYHHQLLGAQWMVSRELSATPPYGGLLADSMGLGKTVQTLACMIANPPRDEDKKRKTKATLIVVPSAVILQWMEEIRNHAEASMFPKVMHYKSSSGIDAAVLEDLDIVITSYHEVMRQFPYPDQKERERIAHMGHQKWWAKVQKDMGPLHQVEWYRVVLDESHNIRNNSNRTSLACQNLRGVFRWCLTGTPLLNRLEELFPYLRFLKANYSMDWKTFQKHFCDSDASDCHQRVETLLSYTMMRRTMKTTILNRPIIVLPKPHPEIQYINFSTEERVIYRITENRYRANLNTYFQRATKGEENRVHYSFLVLLLRLRQCTSHPFMLEQTIKESWNTEDMEELRTHLRRRKKDRTPFYEQCKVWVSQSEAERRAAEEARERGEDVPESLAVMPFGRSNFGHKFMIDKALFSLDQHKFDRRVFCCLCSDIPETPTITDCGHIFCKECLENYMHQHVAEYEDETFACPSCDRMFTRIEPYKAMHLTGDEDEDMSSQGGTPSLRQGSFGSRSSKGRRGGGKGRDLMGIEPVTKCSQWINRSDHDPKFPLTPSAKTTALKAILLKGFTEAPLDKVVIYVQFRQLARIVGRICESEDWGFIYLTGDTSLDHRAKAIHKFRTDPEAKILISGLKCGGQGLNFPWANRCISLDLWWNHAVEQQAFGRIFRIGQLKETYMTRIVVRNSVDMRLLNMQMHKLKTCERAIQDSTKKKHLNLDMKGLASLFGFLRTDEDGNILGIEADYDDSEELDAESATEEHEGSPSGSAGED